MNRFLYSKKMLCILSALLMVTFFLPDIIGPFPALIIGCITIGLSLFVYNEWSKTADKPSPEDTQKTE